MSLKAEGKGVPVRIARSYRGKCGICYKPIIKGDAYESGIGATNIRAGYIAHYNCYKPSGAPTYEELKKIKGGNPMARRKSRTLKILGAPILSVLVIGGIVWWLAKRQ